MKKIENRQYENERALYALKDTVLDNCTFKGKIDGESPLKESSNIEVLNSFFSLRYPLWHNSNSLIDNVIFEDTSRAPFWYANNTKIKNSKVYGIKFLRECNDIEIENSEFYSDEFAWKSNNLKINNSIIESVYPFFSTNNIVLNNVKLKGKYSFQYVKNLEINDSYFDTKDAFWHSENITIKNSTIKGEYLAWFSKNITFINCKIIGTQPICYSENIVFKNCEMIDADFAFENSTIDVELTSDLISIKNPISGRIIAKKIGEIIIDEYKKEGKVEIIELEK